jgi:predicted dehydrogenase
MPKGAPYNVGQLYTRFARAIRSGDVSPSRATFETAVDLHRLIDAMRQSSEQGHQVTVSAAS